MRPENRIRRVPRVDPDTLVDPGTLLMRKPIAELPMSIRAINMLEENDILTVEDLLRQTYESLTCMKNFGEITMREVQKALRDLQIEPPDWNPPRKAKKTPNRKRSDFIDLYG